MPRIIWKVIVCVGAVILMEQVKRFFLGMRDSIREIAADVQRIQDKLDENPNDNFEDAYQETPAAIAQRQREAAKNGL